MNDEGISFIFMNNNNNEIPKLWIWKVMNEYQKYENEW